MPNWVTNTLTITGDAQLLATIADTVKAGDSPDDDAEAGAPISFQRIIPRPGEADADWYDWNVNHWGTKWDACRPETEHSDDALVYRFDTAWAPPMPVVAALSTAHPAATVSLDYEEEQGWGGAISFLGGEIVDESDYDIPMSHQERHELDKGCWCGPDNPVFPDCRYFDILERVRSGTLTAPEEVLEIVRELAANWQGSTDELLNAARSIAAGRSCAARV